MGNNGQVKFNLPAPPSANRIWRVSRGTVHKSKEYRSWLKDNQWAVRVQTSSEALSGPISVTITVHPRDGRLRDIDNYAKPVLDFCEVCGLIENDRQVERLFILRGEKMQRHHVAVTVTPIPPRPPCQ